MRQTLIILLVSLPLLAAAKGKDDYVAPPVQRPPAPSGKQHTRTPSCPNGYYFQDDHCVTKQEVPETHTCPPGTTEQHGQCFSYTPARFTCPGGLALKGEECVGSETINRVNQCPSGATIVGRDCVVHISKVPTCPSGTAAIGERCARLTPMTKDCPTGYSPRGDLCAAQEYSAPLRICPTGTYEENGTCKVVTQAVEECPEGTFDVGMGRCATYTHKTKECPKGYSPVGNNCVRTESVPKQALCPNGADPNDRCRVTVPVPESPVCKTGKLVNNQCYKPRRYQPSYVCPDGYKLQRGSTCTKTSTYDCSETHHDIECEQVPTGKSAHLRMLGADAKGKYQSVPYTKRTATVPLPVCHKVPRSKPKTCEKILTAQAESICGPSGGQGGVGVMKAGGYCEVDEYFAPQYRCDAQTDGGNCFVEETTSVIRACPPGYVNSGSSCTRTETVAPSFFCPPGTEEPSCATYVPKKCLHGGYAGDCSATHKEAPQVMCPEGYHMLEGGRGPAADEDHRCTKSVYTDKVARCPRGTVQIEDMTCASFVDKVASSHDKRVPMQQLCPEGYAEEGDKCVKRIVSPALPECPSGSIIEGNSCAQTVPQTSSCPKGAVLDKGRCWAFSTTQPILVDTVVKVGGGAGKGY